MRNLKVLSVLFAALLLTFVACKKDDDEEPTKQIEISQVEISPDNSTITVTFNQMVYGNTEKTEALKNESFDLTITSISQDTATFSVSHVAGETSATISLVFANELDGDESIEVKAKADKVFGEAGNALIADISESIEVNTDKVKIDSYSLSDDNKSFIVTFNQAVYKTGNMTGALDNESLLVSFTGENVVDVNYSVAHVAGEKIASITIEYLNRVDPDQMIEVTAVANMVFNIKGEALEANEKVEASVNDLGIIGNWKAYDISIILTNLLYDDSLYANFYQDQSYLVTAYVAGVPQIFEGSYEMEKSANDDIWEITLNQSSPDSRISEGIFKVYPAAQDSMWYEVVQIDPAIPGFSPPTSDGGFGSTSGGAYGTINIQKYHWIEQD